MASLLEQVHAACDSLAACEEEDAICSARSDVARTLHQLLAHVSQGDVPLPEREKIDASLSPRATALKGALLKALKVCALYRAFTGLPLLMEQTRRLLTAAPTSGVATYLEKELCADIEACSDRRALECVGEVLSFILAKGRLKKELAGFDLPSRSKQSVRTACNCAEKRVLALQAEERRKELAAAGSDARSKQQVHSFCLVWLQKLCLHRPRPTP